MKAAVYYESGPPDVFRYEDVPDPVCRPGGILLDVHAVSIEGGDTLHRLRGVVQNPPHVVGYQAAGVVREVGERVTRFKPGDRVVATMPNGSHAAIASAAEQAVFHVPDGMDLLDAAVVPIAFGTADLCLFEFGRLQPGETVLIHAAAGGVGLAAVQIAKRAGATVIGTASSDERLARLREYGLDHGVNYREADPASEVLRLTDQKGADLVVDPVGGRTLESSIAALAYRGRISWVGQAGRDDSPPRVWPLIQVNGSITGVYLGAALSRENDFARAVIERNLSAVHQGELKAVVDRTFPLSEAAEAHRYIESRQAFGRVLLIP